MAQYEIPLTSDAQTFAIQLAGVSYRITLRWIGGDQGGWIIDIADAQAVPILTGIPLVTGADLLAQFAYLNFGGSLVVQTDHAPDDVPTYANLGDTSHLYFVTQ